MSSVIVSDNKPPKIVTPQEMSAQSAMNRVRDILDKQFPSYIVVVGDHSIPFGACVDRAGVWTQVLANVLSQNPALRHAVVMLCLDAERQAIEAQSALQKHVLHKEQVASDSHGPVQPA